MSRFGKKTETESNITHNERLEFLGDAVVEFLTSIHLFHMFPDLEEGGLATYRAAIVQNQHLAVLAKVRTGVDRLVRCVICPLCSVEKGNTVMAAWLVILCG
jgi:dsRNA-specific ribonuclease